MNMKFMFSIMLTLFAPTAHAWGLHYLVTDRALATPQFESLLDEKIQTEPLETFLSDQNSELKILFENYYAWLGTTGSKRFKAGIFDSAHPTLQAFLRAARLNPDTQFPLVNRILPGQTPRFIAFPYSRLAPDEKPQPRLAFNFEEVTGQWVSVRSILHTFADEPDWTLDSGLWKHPSFGYGNPPYGKPTGESAGAAFHTRFAHENWMIRMLAPEVLDGMAQDRMELFTRLSQLAFRTRHPYWGFRFAGQAFHYIQDLSQPYHAKAAPHADLWFYLRFAFSSEKDRIKRDTTQIVFNRHHLYEDFISVLLQRSYLQTDPISQRIVQALQEGDGVWTELLDDPTAIPLFDRITELSANQSFALDQGVVLAYGPEQTKDPSYDIEKDTDYNIEAVFTQKSPERFEALLKETDSALKRTGEATRTLLLYCLKGRVK